MGQFRNFEDIEAWQEARTLIRIVRALCRDEAVKRDFAFVDQITRAARSICANIAEGNDAMTPPEFISFLGIAKRSAAEVRSHLYDALDEKYIDQEEFDSLAGLIHHLQSLDPKLKRTYASSNQPINQ